MKDTTPGTYSNPSSRRKKLHPLVTGTLILTATGLASRLIGFFYRIYLARLFGEEGMGIYQLIGPVLSLSFSLTAAGYQTAVSKLVAENTARQKGRSLKPFAAALSISVPLSLLCNFLLCRFSEQIAVSFLLEIRTAPMLRILSFSIPAAAIHACINGYFYGIKKAGVPAFTQLIEQLIRVGSVYAASSRALACGIAPTVDMAVWGLLIGETLSMLAAVLFMYFFLKKGPVLQGVLPCAAAGNKSLPYRALMGMVLPLTLNRIVLNLLQSVESVSIPARLKLYGCDNASALSVYGVLTGMAMPLIFFPNALTSSVSVLLLPVISEAYAMKDMKKVRDYTLRTVKLCVLMGSFCMAFFLFSGSWIGENLFHSALAGHFIMTLGFLSPFLYLDTTLSSILQGLGMSGRIFFMNVISLLTRLAFVFLAIPMAGITGYLWGILGSQILLSVLYLTCLLRMPYMRKRPAG